MFWSVKTTKELLKKRREDSKVPFIFWIYFCVQEPFCGRWNHSWIEMKRLRLTDHVLKCVWGFRVDMSNIQCFSLGLLVTETAAWGDTVLHQVRDLHGYVRCPRTAKGKRARLVSKVKLKCRQISFFYFAHASHDFLLGASGRFSISLIYFVLFYFFLFTTNPKKKRLFSFCSSCLKDI